MIYRKTKDIVTNDITDLNLTGAASGQALVYQSSTNTWVPRAVTSVKNFNPKYYPKTRKAIANLALGTGFSVLCVGDSTTQGYNGVTLTNCKSFSWTRRLADMLTAKGSRGGWQNVLGNSRTDSQSSTIQITDSRVSAFPAGWALTSTISLVSGIGGYAFYNGTNTNAFTFTPTVQTDTLDVYYFDVSGYDTITIKSGATGTTAATTGGTVAITSTNTLKKATATYTLGNNVWTVQKTNANGASLIIQGVAAYNSTTPEIQFLNCGCGGQTTSFFTDTSQGFWSTLNEMSSGALLSPLTIINLGINDWVAGTSLSTMTTNLTTIVTALQSAGSEVLLIVPVPSVIGTASAANQAAVVSAIYAVSTAKNVALIDLTERMVDGATALANGYLGDNVVHPSSFAYNDIATGIYQFFNSL